MPADRPAGTVSIGPDATSIMSSTEPPTIDFGDPQIGADPFRAVRRGSSRALDRADTDRVDRPSLRRVPGAVPRQPVHDLE